MKILAVLLLFMALAFSRAEAMSVDELLLDHLVEKGVISADAASAIRADAAQKTQDENALITSFPVLGKSKINASGYLQVLYASDATAGTFDNFKVRRARLDFKGDVGKQVGYELQIDAVQTLKSAVATVTQTGSGTTAAVRSTSAVYVSRPIVLDAYINYYLDPALNFSAGQMKIPFGWENLWSDAALDTIDRSQVTEKFVPGRDNGSQGRDFGVTMNGGLDFGRDNKLFDYAVGVFNGSGLYCDEDNKRKDLVGRVVYYPVPNLTVGFDLYGGKTGTGTAEADKIRDGVELIFNAGKFFFKGEYISGRDGTTNRYGWYALTGLRLNPAIDLIARYDLFDPSTVTANDSTGVSTLGVNWYLNKSAKIQANYLIKAEEKYQIDNNVLEVQSQVQF
ncbi:MAG TPA: porin [Candidatus Omnitrophota bacterium]|nr:porin [Candidatus Omnitrophota bacterium]